MTTITRADWLQSPEIMVGENEHRRLVTAALTDVSKDPEPIDFLLYELDRAKVMADERLPPDIVRLDSIVRYQTHGSNERTIKLVLPEEVGGNIDYRLSVTSLHGAALLGLSPGQVLTWLGADGVTNQVQVTKVANDLALEATDI
jgi:regulator of nucleoside diphosphate kinase